MKIQLTLVSLVILIINSSFQCNKCEDKPNYLIDNSRQWLPLKGQTQLTFLNTNGIAIIFKLQVADTIEVETSCNFSTYEYESIRGKLSLDTMDKDLITFAIHPPNNLCIRCYTNTSNEVGGCEILSKPIFNGKAIRLANFNLGINTYPEIILLKSSLNTPIIDSVIVAKNFGFVGFKYKGESYTLQ